MNWFFNKKSPKNLISIHSFEFRVFIIVRNVPRDASNVYKHLFLLLSHGIPFAIMWRQGIKLFFNRINIYSLYERLEGKHRVYIHALSVWKVFKRIHLLTDSEQRGDFFSCCFRGIYWEFRGNSNSPKYQFQVLYTSFPRIPQGQRRAAIHTKCSASRRACKNLKIQSRQS